MGNTQVDLDQILALNDLMDDLQNARLWYIYWGDHDNEVKQSKWAVKMQELIQEIYDKTSEILGEK